MHIKRVQQETTFGCGRACLAMILGVSFADVQEMFNPRKEFTSTKDLIRVLHENGFNCPDRLQRVTAKRKLSNLCIAKISFKRYKGRWHWVVISGNKRYDPYYGFGVESVHDPIRGRITSFLPISRSK